MQAERNLKLKKLADEREYILFTPMDSKVNAHEIILVLEHWIADFKEDIKKALEAEKEKASEVKEEKADE